LIGVKSGCARRAIGSDETFDVRNRSRCAHYIWGLDPHQGTSPSVRLVLLPLDVLHRATVR
jgi:hypothetical protein